MPRSTLTDEEPASQRQHNVNPANEHLHLDLRTNDGGQSLSRSDAENADRHRNSELKFVACLDESSPSCLGKAKVDEERFAVESANMTAK